MKLNSFEDFRHISEHVHHWFHYISLSWYNNQQTNIMIQIYLHKEQLISCNFFYFHFSNWYTILSFKEIVIDFTLSKLWSHAQLCENMEKYSECADVKLNTVQSAWKVPKHGVFSGPYLDTFHNVIFAGWTECNSKQNMHSWTKDLFLLNTYLLNMARHKYLFFGLNWHFIVTMHRSSFS